MRRRIYFVLPDIESARRTMDDLLLMRIEQSHIHFLARRGMPLDGLKEANHLQKSDILHGAKLGAVVGAVVGCAAGGVFAWHFVAGETPQILTVIAAAIFGALFGAWAASMVGSAVPNSQLKQFQKQIDDGRILLMVDVPEHKVAEIQERLRQRHPEAADGGLEPNIPAFP